MMQKYDAAAKAKGVCIVPHCGIDSVPSDMMAYLCAKAAREHCNVGIRDCVNSIQKISFKASGGTSHTAIGLVEAYPLRFLAASLRPTALCPIPAPKVKPSTTGVLPSVLGWRHVKDLGLLTDSPSAGADVGIVYRSWALLDGGRYYGPNFSFTEYLRTPNVITGMLTHYLLGLALFALYLRPFRWLLRRFAYVQGTGQDRQEANKGRLVFKAVATADEPRKRRTFASFEYNGAGYYMTGITLVEAAMVLLRDGDVLGKRLAGMITTATLGYGYVERLRKAGIKLEYGMLDP
ncbi:hypothetical protein, variant 2 [Verruconis gallopava]|nr:hypothetical protein, variant 1 [Verruconis gallopava]XP_016212292.1 hypothetical protein, variant 2 [Verruconis gallopava]KIW02422.1 hypothetical protein, variant 1 [Verruconis gallopava]KIW02423.1 hypothetical protein, variant 2 [Verruconis gallopava]